MAPSTVGGGTEDWALPGVDLGHAAFERGDPNTRLNPSLRFRTCNMEITIPFSRRAARIDGDARREGAWLGGSAATGRALTRHPARRRA